MTKLLLALFFLAAPQGANGLRGQIMIPTTQTQGRLEVILEKSDAFFARTFTDAEGHYRFDNLANGNYALVVKVDGYEEVHEPVYFGRDGDSTLNITLTRKSSAEPNSASLETRYPKNAVADYEKALDDNRKGNSAKAIERLEAVVKSTPNFEEAHNALGTFYQKAQRFQDAEKEYNNALQLDPKSSEPLVNLGSLYIQIAEQAQAKRDNQTFGAALDGAVRALKMAIQVQPDSAKAYYYLGTTYYTGGQFPNAEENLMHALQLEKGMGTAELVLANVYIKQQKWKQALEYLDAYLKDNPKATDRDQVQQTRNKVAAQK